MKILFVGLGSIGQRHVRNIRKVYGDSIEIIAYRVRRLQMTFSDTMQIREGVNLEEEHGITSYDNLEEALNQKPDIMYVTNITAKHMECAMEAARRGIHIFLEKPVSNSMEGVEAFALLAEKNGCKVFMGYQNRFHPVIKKLREYLESDVLGRLITVESAFCERLITMHTYEDYSTTYMARKDMGGGPVLNLQIHDIDILQWLFGQPIEGTLNAITGTHSSLKIDVEDHAVISYKTVYKGNELTCTTRSDFLSFPPIHTMRVIGEKGRIELDFNKAEIIFIPGEGNAETTTYTDFVRNDMFIEELKSFMDSVISDKDTLIPLGEGIKGLKIALAAKQ